MAGLLDFLNTDESRLGLGLLAAAGPSATPLSFGQRLQGAMQGLDEQKILKMKSSLLQSQIDENASQNAQRKYAIQKQEDLNRLLSGLFGSGEPSMSPGAYAPSADGMGPTIPASMAPARPSGIGGMTADQVALLKARGADFTDIWKFQQEPQKLEQGSTYLDRRTGQQRYMPKVGEGVAADANGFYAPLPGYAAAQGTIEGAKAQATEGAKAGFDLTTVTPKDGQPLMSTRGSLVRSMSAPAPGFGAPNGDQFAILSQELEKAKASGNAGDVAALTREIARLPRGSSSAPSASGLAGIPLQSPSQADAASQFAKDSAKSGVDSVMKGYEGARAAVDTISANVEARKSLAGGSFLGTGAETKLAIAKAAQSMGFDVSPDKVANTDYLQSTLGQGILNKAKTLGANPTDNDARIIRSIVGSIGTDPQALVKLLDYQDVMANRSIEQHNKNYSSAKSRGFDAGYDLTVSAPVTKAGPAAGNAPNFRFEGGKLVKVN